MSPTGNPDGALRPETSRCHRRLSKDPADRATSSQPLRLQLPVDPVGPSVARQRVRQWLTGWFWPAGQLEDIVLAVSEAVSNAIEHAYLDQPPDVVDIHGELEAAPGGQRRVTVVVRDYGRWRPPPIDDENRRRGIPLMRACMDNVAIMRPDDNRAGTCVMLRSRAVPPCLRVLGAPDNEGDEDRERI